MNVSEAKERREFLRKRVKQVEKKLGLLREELRAVEVQVFQNCEHSWVRTDDDEGSNSYWYSYCPWTCEHCGYFKSGPVKL